MNFSENLIKLRRKKGLSQEELGNELNVARQTISKWELGETTPDMNKLIELSNLFEISIDELVGNKNYKYNKKLRQYIRFDYVYQSKKNINGIPLVSIDIGKGKRTAKGIIAIGNKAIGLIAIGGLALGIFSFGGLALGIFSLAALAISLLLAVGGLALGGVAIGGLALGVLAIGGLALGIYSLGGLALAKDIACGGYANGHIAIGQVVHGTKEIVIDNVTSKTPAEIRKTILYEFPNIWTIIVWFFSNTF